MAGHTLSAASRSLDALPEPSPMGSHGADSSSAATSSSGVDHTPKSVGGSTPWASSATWSSSASSSSATGIGTRGGAFGGSTGALDAPKNDSMGLSIDD